MNKTDIIDQIAEVLGDRHQAKAAVNSMLAHIGDALKNNESVALNGFGTFKRVQRKARQGVNPRTGERIKIEAHHVARFTPASRLQKAVN
jgi:DNA-binding protein HU-beta